MILIIQKVCVRLFPAFHLLQLFTRDNVLSKRNNYICKICKLLRLNFSKPLKLNHSHHTNGGQSVSQSWYAAPPRAHDEISLAAFFGRPF